MIRVEALHKNFGNLRAVDGISFEAAEQNMLGHVSLRRKVSAQDIADMALFLCSPSGRNISGQALSVCGNVETI